MDRPEPNNRMPADTGGVVDLDRIIGNIPIVFVFLPAVRVDQEPEQAELPPGDPATPERVVEPILELLRGLGDRLIEFGHHRVQVLGVHPFEQEDVILLGREADSTARIIADPDRRLADAFGVAYDDRAHVVILGNDGHVVDHWSADPTPGFAERVLEHTAGLGFT